MRAGGAARPKQQSAATRWLCWGAALASMPA